MPLKWEKTKIWASKCNHVDDEVNICSLIYQKTKNSAPELRCLSLERDLRRKSKTIWGIRFKDIPNDWESQCGWTESQRERNKDYNVSNKELEWPQYVQLCLDFCTPLLDSMYLLGGEFFGLGLLDWYWPLFLILRGPKGNTNYGTFFLDRILL